VRKKGFFLLLYTYRGKRTRASGEVRALREGKDSEATESPQVEREGRENMLNSRMVGVGGGGPPTGRTKAKNP